MKSIHAHERRVIAPVRKILPLLLVIVVCAAGCGEPGASPDGIAVSDTTAYQAAMSAGDTTSVIQALGRFLDDYPQSPFRPGVYSRLFSLKDARDPAEAGAFVRTRLETEVDPASRGRLYYALYLNTRDHDPDREGEVIEALISDSPLTPDVYNMVAWNLVERETMLEEAVRLAVIGVSLADDSVSRGNILDTQGRAKYKMGSLAEAVFLLEEAVSLNPDPEIRRHLAEAYDRSGRREEALEMFTELMISQENPDMRSSIERLAAETGRSAPDIFRRIDTARHEAAWPAPEFTLIDYDGQPVSLGDFRGKVVLLNFWHPT